MGHHTIYYITDVYDFCKRRIAKDRYYFIIELYNDHIKDFLWNEMQNARGEINRTGLAQYIHEDEKIYNKVFAIGYEMYGQHCVFPCIVRDDFNEEDDKELKDYLNGQISDGWGENGVYILNLFENKLKDIALENKVRRCWKLDTSDDPIYIDDWDEYVKIYKEKRGIDLNALGFKRV